jgi:Aldehyde dehydrogenase family
VVGAKVAQRATSQLKKTVLELEGSDPFIVCEDANRENASSGSSLPMIITLVVVYTNGLSDRMTISILHNTLPFNRTYSIIPILSILLPQHYNILLL